MFGRVANTLNRNAIICLSVTAAMLLLAGLCLAVTAPSASAQVPQRSTPARAAQADTTAATVPADVFGANYWGAVRFIDSARWP